MKKGCDVIADRTRDRAQRRPRTNQLCLHPSSYTSIQKLSVRLCPHVSDFILKTEILCSGLGYFSHISGENNHLKRIFSKTLSRVCLVPRRFTLVLVVQYVLVSWVFSCVHTTMLKYRVSFRKSFGQS